jgi:small subunit ribosomal protein S20
VANKKASRKSILQTQKHAAGNGVVRSRLKTLEKKLRVAIASGSEGVRGFAADYVSALDKAAKRNVIHRNSADRRKVVFAKYAF